jgi:putative ABC transport system permease protein
MPRHILTFALSVRFERFPQPEQMNTFYRDLLEKVSALPGISSAAASIVGASWGMDFSIAGQPADHPFSGDRLVSRW